MMTRDIWVSNRSTEKSLWRGRGVPTGWKPVLPGPWGPYPLPHAPSPNPKIREHRHLACAAQAGSLCSRTKDGKGLFTLHGWAKGPLVTVLYFFAAAFFLAASLQVCGCGVRQLAKGELLPPEVRLKALGLQPPGKQGWPLNLVLAVDNPNPMTIKVLGYDYEVRVEGQSVAQGTGERAVILPAKGEALVEVPVILKLRNLPALLPKLLQDEKLTVDITGGLRLPQTLGFRVPFRFREKVAPQEGLEHLKPFLSP
jgi:hypothetical protein